MRGALFILICLFYIIADAGREALGAERIDLRPRLESTACTQVTIDLTAGGHTVVRQATEGEKEPAERKLPMSVAAKLNYHERLLPADGDGDATLLAGRYYGQAEAVLKAGESGRAPRLADDRSLIVVAADGGRPTIFSPVGPLYRGELDLIDIVGNSCLVDRLLPSDLVADGDTWDHDDLLMRDFLTLESVAACEVQSVLDAHNANYAKLRMEGVVHGMADGAATELEIRAVYLFDRKQRRVTKLNLAVREKRSIGAATPGLDAVAKLQMNIEPSEAPPELNDAVVAKLAAARRAASQDVVYEAASLGFRAKHDHHWYVTSEQRESVTLRRVERGDLVAQCTLVSLPPKSAGRQTTFEQFQKDVTYSLGKSFGELVSNRQWQNAAGHYCYELVTRGLVEDVPVEWHHFLIAPESGHRISMAVTIEKPMVERLGNHDRDLVESLELFPRMPEVKTAAQPQEMSSRK